MLVFVQSKQRATQLYTELVYDSLKVDVIHSDRTVAQRTNIIKQFRSGDIWVLICTELMARGIDFKGVNTVINFDFPQSTVSYIHRIGRSGRAGREGHAVTFFTETDAPLLRSVAGVMSASGCSIPQWMLDLGKNSKKRKQLMQKAPSRTPITPQAPGSSAKRKRGKPSSAAEAGEKTQKQKPGSKKKKSKKKSKYSVPKKVTE